MKEKNKVIITLADNNYVKQAKQLFSSVYFNSGWSGDYVLLSQEISEKKLKWFRDKGIIIKKIKPFVKNRLVSHPGTVLSKTYIFETYFKKWKNVIFLDADIIVRNSLDRLCNVKKIGFVNGVRDKKMDKKFVDKELLDEKELKKYNELKNRGILKKRGINGGVISYNTKIIEKDTIKRIKQTYNRYKKIIKNDEGLFGIYFHKELEMIPRVYNVTTGAFLRKLKVKPKRINGIIIHFVDSENPKPWSKKSIFYKEWSKYYKLSDKIDLSKEIQAKDKWSNLKITIESLKIDLLNKKADFLRMKNKIMGKIIIKLNKHGIIFSKKRIRLQKNKVKDITHKNLGKVGRKIKKVSPKIYSKIKKVFPI